MNRVAIVNVNLQYEIPDNVKTERDLMEFVENVELPKEYITGSFEFVKIAEE